MDEPTVEPPSESTARYLASPAFFLATGGGVGLLGFAPGTLGTLWGIPLTLAIHLLPGTAWQAMCVVVLAVIGIPICTAAARRLGRKDPGAVVWDEIASLPITFFLVPREQIGSPWILFAGFVLHRLFDISKPPPCRQLESLPDGLGIMADDWVAGLYSCACLQALLYGGWIG